MTLSKLQGEQLHYRAWSKLKDTLIADFNRRMRESNECVTELGVLNTMQKLEELVMEINYASDNMKYFASEVQRIQAETGMGE